MGWYDVFNYTTDGVNVDGASRQMRQIVAADTSSYSGTKIRVTIKAGTGATACNVNGTSIGVSAANDDYSGTPARITWDGGSSTTTIAQNASKVSDEITFTFTKTNRHLLHFLTTYRNIAYETITENVYFTTDVGTDQTLTSSVSYGSLSSQCLFIRLEVWVDEGKPAQAYILQRHMRS